MTGFNMRYVVSIDILRRQIFKNVLFLYAIEIYVFGVVKVVIKWNITYSHVSPIPISV